MNHKESQKGNIGISSIVVIFTVLCLTIFSILSLSTAMNERRLAEKSAQAVADYYAADLICAETAAEVQEMLDSGDSLDDIEAWAMLSGIDYWNEGRDLYLSYETPVDEKQELAVTLRLIERGGRMEITTWQMRETGEWTPDGSIIVWDGN